MDSKKLIALLLAALLEDDDSPAAVAPKATLKVAPKTTAKATAKPVSSSKHMAASTEEPDTTEVPVVHKAFPMIEGTVTFDNVGTVKITTPAKGFLVTRDGLTLNTEQTYGNHKFKVWTYGASNLTFKWPRFLEVWGSSSRWQSVAVSAKDGQLYSLPEDKDLLNEVLDSDPDDGQNMFRINWRRTSPTE